MRAFVVLEFVVLGLSTIGASVVLDADKTTSDCRPRAWVRAPDLEPGKVLQGDVRIKLEGTCPDVSSYSIGLRFMERSWVKARRDGVIFPEPPRGNGVLFNFTSSNNSIFEPVTFRSEFLSSGGICLEDEVEQSAWKTYKNIIRDPTHWLAREEERIGFETKFVLHEGERLSHELVDHFGILVPFTNYPPAFDMAYSNMLSILAGEGTDFADAEHVYAYFVEMEFANGTRHEVPAGFTSFRAAFNPGQSEMEVVEVVADHSPICKMGQDCSTEEKKTSQDKLTLEVKFPTGRRFAQGSSNNVTVITHQTGPGLLRPLGLKSLRTEGQTTLNWAATFAPDNETAKTILTSGTIRTSQLVPVIDNVLFHRQFLFELMNSEESPRFLQTRASENGTGFSTEAIAVHFNVPQYCYPSFVTYYQTTEISLEITLEVRNDSSTNMNTPKDDFDWTPIKEETEEFRATIPLTVYSQPSEEGPFEDEPVHYLSPDARSPVFVAPSTISELKLKSRADRDALAPISQEKILTTIDREIVKHRYYDINSTPREASQAPPYYVGDVWLRKVMANGNGVDLETQPPPLTVQT